MIKIAFLIMNHRDPAQLLRLAGTLRLELPDAPIIVHNDRFRVDFEPSVLEPLGNTHLLANEKPLAWGSFEFVETYWRSVKWIDENVDFDWLVLLSSQDYPIKPLVDFAEHLAGTGANAMVLATPIDQIEDKSDRRNRRRRYLYQYRRPAKPEPGGLEDNARRWLRRHTAFLVDVLNNVQPFFQIYKYPDQMPWRIGWRARSTPFSRSEPCWFGSSWITLSRHAAKVLVENVNDRPDYVEYFRRTVLSDESATNTLICNAPNVRTELVDSHYVRWTHATSGHPDIFSAKDLPELLARPECFARKFDLNTDAEILDLLDDMLAQARAAADRPVPEVRQS